MSKKFNLLRYAAGEEKFGVKTGRSLVAEHAIECAERELTDEDRNILANHDIMEMDLGELERRTLDKLQQDAENMSEGQIFKRASDPDGIDTQELLTLIALKSSNEGVLDYMDFHKKLAAGLFAIREEDVTPGQRDFAKSYSFADLMGATDITKSKLFRNARIIARDKFEKS